MRKRYMRTRYDGGSWWDRQPRAIQWTVGILIALYLGGGLLAGTVALLRMP